MNKYPIGIFDSGVGGLTVFSEIVKELPREDVVYLGDTARLPYGTKSKETIIEYSKQCVRFLIAKEVKLIVVACGTASSQAVENIKEIYSIPVTGIIKPTIENLNFEKDKKVGVIATAGTIRSNAWEEEIKNKKDVKIISRACPILVSLAEEGWTGNDIAKATVSKYMEPFKGNNVDKLILGCTHFPLFKSLIEEELGKKVDIIDTGKEVAKSIKKLLKEKEMENDELNIGEHKFFLTDTSKNFITVAERLLGKKIEAEKVRI